MGLFTYEDNFGFWRGPFLEEQMTEFLYKDLLHQGTNVKVDNAEYTIRELIFKNGRANPFHFCPSLQQQQFENAWSNTPNDLATISGIAPQYPGAVFGSGMTTVLEQTKLVASRAELLQLRNNLQLERAEFEEQKSVWMLGCMEKERENKENEMVNIDLGINLEMKGKELQELYTKFEEDKNEWIRENSEKEMKLSVMVEKLKGRVGDLELAVDSLAKEKAEIESICAELDLKCLELESRCLDINTKSFSASNENILHYEELDPQGVINNSEDLQKKFDEVHHSNEVLLKEKELRQEEMKMMTEEENKLRDELRKANEDIQNMKDNEKQVPKGKLHKIEEQRNTLQLDKAQFEEYKLEWMRKCAEKEKALHGTAPFVDNEFQVLDGISKEDTDQAVSEPHDAPSGEAEVEVAPPALRLFELEEWEVGDPESDAKQLSLVMKEKEKIQKSLDEADIQEKKLREALTKAYETIKDFRAKEKAKPPQKTISVGAVILKDAREKIKGRPMCCRKLGEEILRLAETYLKLKYSDMLNAREYMTQEVSNIYRRLKMEARKNRQVKRINESKRRFLDVVHYILKIKNRRLVLRMKELVAISDRLKDSFTSSAAPSEADDYSETEYSSEYEITSDSEGAETDSETFEEGSSDNESS